MMWLLAILVVLALGGVAVVASGRGTPMREEHRDRPDVLVPAEGPLAAADLRRVRFTLAFRGYRMDEVDALLDRLAREREAVEQAQPGVPPAGPDQPDRPERPEPPEAGSGAGLTAPGTSAPASPRTPRRRPGGRRWRR